MALEHHQHPLDLRGGRFRRQALRQDWPAGQRSSTYKHTFNKVSSLHDSISNDLNDRSRTDPGFQSCNLKRRRLYTLRDGFASAKITAKTNTNHVDDIRPA
jgi:hypothetical protein